MYKNINALTKLGDFFIKFKKIYDSKLIFDSTKRKLIKKTDQLLEMRMYDVFLEVVKNGYQPTPLQKDLLSNIIKYAISKREGSTEAAHLIETGYELSDEDIKTIFFHYSFMIYEHDFLCKPDSYYLNNDHYKNQLCSNEVDVKLWFLSAKQIKEKLNKDLSLSQKLYEKWLNLIINEDFLHFEYKILLPYKTMEQLWSKFLTNNDCEIILKKISQNEKYQFNKYNVELKEKISQVLKHINADETKQLLQEIKAIYINNNIQNNTIQKQKEKVLTFSFEQLPHNIRNLITEIESLCKKLELSKNAHIRLTVDKIIEQTLPNTISKYFSIDEEYRESLTNKEGKNAKDLFVESLNNIKEMLIMLLEDNNEDKLKELQINTLYTKYLAAENK